MEAPPNLTREPFDLSVFFEDLPLTPGAVEICRDVIFPVCAPVLAERLKRPSDLAQVSCLQDANWTDDWRRWLAAAAPDDLVDLRGPVFSLYSLAVEEARNGAGVVMGHEPLVRGHLESGELVAPFRARLEPDRAMAITMAKPVTATSVLGRVRDALATG